MADYKTQCPHCGTQFKLTEQHMSQAGGMVRCGSCLKPFQAKEYLVESPQQAVKTNKSSGNDEDWAHQLLADEGVKETPADPPAKPKKKTGSRWQMPEDPPEITASDGDDALSLGDETELTSELDEMETGGFGDISTTDFSDVEGAGHNNQVMTDDESWAEALLKEAEDEVEEAEKAKKAKPERKPKPTRRLDTTAKETNTQATPASLFDFDDNEFDLGNLSGSDHSQEYQAAMQHADDDTTTNLIKWGSLSLLLLIIFGLQFLVFNFNELSRQTTLRPFYKQACRVLSCELPSISNTRKLQATNLLIRSSDSQPGILMVDLLLHNEGKHPQPFPRLEISFSNLHQKIMAAGIFMPADYLGNNLNGMKNLPAESQVHVSFRINAPEKPAQNFSLKLLSPLAGC